jgi:hypothetical protein
MPSASEPGRKRWYVESHNPITISVIQLLTGEGKLISKKGLNGVVHFVVEIYYFETVALIWRSRGEKVRLRFDVWKSFGNGPLCMCSKLEIAREVRRFDHFPLAA